MSYIPASRLSIPDSIVKGVKHSLSVGRLLVNSVSVNRNPHYYSVSSELVLTTTAQIPDKRTLYLVVLRTQPHAIIQ